MSPREALVAKVGANGSVLFYILYHTSALRVEFRNSFNCYILTYVRTVIKMLTSTWRN